MLHSSQEATGEAERTGILCLSSARLDDPRPFQDCCAEGLEQARTSPVCVFAGALCGTRNGKDGNLLNPEVINPYLDKVVLWFEDADMAEEPTTFQAYSDKLSEVDEFIKKEGAPYFEKKAKEPCQSPFRYDFQAVRCRFRPFSLVRSF